LNQTPSHRTDAERAGIDIHIDHILASEDELMPSSGFLASVMDRVQEDAAASAPIPFPWKRAVPGILLAAGVFVWGFVEFVRLGLPAMGSVTLALPRLPVAALPAFEQACWVAMALGVSLLSWLFSRRLAGRGGLL
jgi:hypothetical protein